MKKGMKEAQVCRQRDVLERVVSDAKRGGGQ